MEKTKIVGNHILTLKRHLSEDKESIVTELGLNDKALNLLREFAVRDEEPIDESSCNNTFKRYKIKNSLHRNLGDNICLLLFHKSLMDTGSLKLQYDSIRDANRILDNSSYLKNVLTQAISLLEDHSVTIDVNVREARV